MTIPRIDTPRLVLRGHRTEDLPDCAAMWADPLVTRHIGGRAFSEEEVWSRLLRYVGHWALLGFGFWALEERGTGRFVGEAGLADFKREGLPPFEGAPEVGWALAPWAHGRGFATEAIAAALAWADGRAIARTLCMIDPENVASSRVAEKCGFRAWQDAVYKGTPTRLFERKP